MKRLFSIVAILFMGIGTAAFAQKADDASSTKPKCGDKPPVWLKNKVSEAQYDSLATFAKYYIVDYDYFKRRNLTQRDINSFVARTAEVIKEKQTSSKLPRDIASGYHVYDYPHKIKPFCMSPVANGAVGEIQFVAYSEIDGWDGHILLKAEMNKDSDGRMRLSNLRFEPYSVSGLKVAIDGIRLADQRSSSKIDSIDIDSNGESPIYRLMGEMKVENAMGYWRTEPFEIRIILALD